jgi:hypothetical protein
MWGWLSPTEGWLTDIQLVPLANLDRDACARVYAVPVALTAVAGLLLLLAHSAHIL